MVVKLKCAFFSLTRMTLERPAGDPGGRRHAKLMNTFKKAPLIN